MDTLVVKLLRLLRPRIGWLPFTLGLAALLCAASAAASAKLPLPAGSFTLAAALGFTIALRLGRPPAAPWPNRAFRAMWVAALLLALLATGALLVVRAADILPPRGLIAEDAAAYLAWLWAGLRGASAPTPEMRALPFLATTLARFWGNLLAAPAGGEAGARLIVLVGGLATTWLAALTLGWALARERALLPWGIPTLAAVTLTALLGGSSGVEVAFALTLILLLLLVNAARRRERRWDARGADYSDELRPDAIAWGACCVMLVIVLAEIIPTTVSNPLADFFWRDVELPSGMAVLERNIPRPQRSSAQIGISQLPALPLGVSLEKAPPSKVILRIHTGTPLPAGPWPRYWRARLFNFYTSAGWTTNARIGDFTTVALTPEDMPGSVLEEIEDLRDDRTIVVGMPDIVTTDLAANAERLPDGSLAALTTVGSATRYQIVSRPQEQAIPPRLDSAPPDMSSYLALPNDYSQRVRDLAQVVAGGRASAYERALALEAYLRGLPYAYTVQPIPPRGDAVEQFLFDMRQGYCTYYASAMAVMARSLGIPARLAIGYATGEFDAASNTYLVRQADAHAWAELYIDGRWLPFEPTPIRPLPARGGGEPDFPTPVPVAPAPAEARNSTNGSWIWAGALALVAALSAALWWRGRPRARPPLALDIQAQLERGGARAGIPWPPGATLREYGRLLAPQAGEPPALDEMTDLLGAARYSGQPLPAAHESHLRAIAERVLARLAQLRRR